MPGSYGVSRLAPCPGVVAELDVAVFAVAVGRASLLCGRRFQPHFLLVGGPAVDRRFAPGLQRFRRTVLQPVEVALVIFGVFRESLHHGDEFIEEFDVGVQRDAPFPFYVGLRVRGDQQDQFVDSGPDAAFDFVDVEPLLGRQFSGLFLFAFESDLISHIASDIDGPFERSGVLLFRRSDGDVQGSRQRFFELGRVRPLDVFPAGVVLVVVAGCAQRYRAGQQQYRDQRGDAPLRDFQR